MNISRNWFLATVGIVVLIIFTIGCTPGKALTRKDSSRVKSGQDYEGDEAADETIVFDDEEEYEPGKNKQSRKKSQFIDDDDENGDESDEGYRKEKYYQTGLASWYGREFHGKRTASGEKFDMNVMTAAHRTLPFGSIVEVKNLDNGKSVRVKVNDRGPFRAKRIIDLSYAAGKKIGIVKSGEARVGIVVVKKGKSDGEEGRTARKKDRRIEPVVDDEGGAGDNDALYEEGPGGYALQIGAFYTRKNAEVLKKKVQRITDSRVTVTQDSDLYKVRIEGIPTKKEVKRFRRILNEEDINSYEVK